MKNLLLILSFVFAGLAAEASTIVTATVTVTNVAGTTNGQTITINSDTRTWTNSVVVAATQILTNNTQAGAAANLLVQAALYPFAPIQMLSQSTTTNVVFKAATDTTITVTLSAGWGTVTYVTNTIGSAVVVRVPYTTEAAAQQTNVASGIGAMINSSANTNPVVQVSSHDIPFAILYTNYIGDGLTLTPGNIGLITNAGQGIILAHTNGTSTVTNTVRFKWAPPWDWNAGAVRVGLVSVCSGTNSSFTTNIVYAVRATSLNQGTALNNLTWGSLVRVTNNVSTNQWVRGFESITADLTVGNSPSWTNGILWEIQRHGADGGDTETNGNLFLSQIKVYFQRNTRTNFPTASP